MDRLFGGEGYGFCEIVDSDRTYEFAVVESETRQLEATLISNLDGPINFVAGLYHYDSQQIIHIKFKQHHGT